MAIYTSRYSNSELQLGKYYAVGISIGKPKYPLRYALREQCYTLAPKGYMLNMQKEQYRRAYFEKLNEYGARRIVQGVRQIQARAEAEGKSLVLLCFEDVRNDNEWCHRTMFAEWWEQHTGEKITELYDPSRPKNKKPEQLPQNNGEQISLL